MSESLRLDPEHRLMPYEKDHISTHRTENVDYFRYDNNNLSEKGVMEWVAKEKKIPLDNIHQMYRVANDIKRSEFLKTFRRDMVFSLLTDFFTRGYRRGTDKQVPEKDRDIMSKRLIEHFKDKESEYFGDYSDITELKIQNGILGIARGKNIRQIDLVHALVKDHDPRRANLQKRTQESTEALKEKISTEVYMAGVLSVEYEQISGHTREAITDVVATGVAAHSVGVPLYRIRKMMVRNKAGKMEEVRPTDSMTGTKLGLEKQLLGSLRSSGYVFDTATQVFKSTTRDAIEKSVRMVMLSTFEQYQKTTGIADTRENRVKFEQTRSTVLTEAQTMLDLQATPETQKKLLDSLSKKLAKISGSILNYGMETIFWGVFFSAYHKNAQDFANLGIGVAEIALFRAGSYAGKFVPAPPILKPFAPMLTGMAFAMLGHMGASFGGADQAFWREFPDREDYSEKDGGREGNSLVGHILTAAPVNAFYDKNQVDLRIGKREGIDMNIPFGNGKTMTLGSMDVGRSTVDMNTPPWEYMGEWMERDQDTWNIQVEKYREWLTVQALNLFRQYDEGKNIFTVGNILARAKGGNYDGAKKEILRDRLVRLFPHFDPEGSDHNKQSINDIIRQALEYVTIKPESRRNQLMGFFIEQQIDMSMNLSNRNLKMYKIQTEKEASFTSELAAHFAQEFTDPNINQYMHQIFGYSDGNINVPSRIINKSRLVKPSSLDNIPKGAKIIESMPNGVWIETELLGTRSKKWIEGWEHKTFRAVIDSKILVKDPLLKEVFGGGKDISVGEVFYKLLNQTVELKRMKEFTANVAQTGRAQKWDDSTGLSGAYEKLQSIIK